MYTEYSNIRELIEHSSVKFADKKAFIIKLKKDTYEDITYTRLRQDVEALGKYFIEEGIAGKRIAVIGKNCYQWMVVFLAVLSTNGVIVPLDRGLFPAELNEQLDRSGAEAIFHTSEFIDALAEREDIIKVQMDSEAFSEIITKGRGLTNDAEYKSIKVDGEKMSILLFTSGTTAASKAVMLCQKNITANVYGMNIWEKFGKTEINMALLPFHHTFGMTQIMLFLNQGFCNVFCEGLRIAKCLTEYKVTMLVGVPRVFDGIYDTIMKKLKAQGKLKTVEIGIKLTSALRKVGIDIRRKVFKQIIDNLGGGLHFMISGAAPADPKVLKFFNDIGITTVQGYGLTETAPVLSAENYNHMRKGSIGKALPNVEIKIDNPDENGIGEIIARGANVMLGYYNDEENTNAVLKNGYFHTGDMGYMDKDGYLYITGRKKNVIVLNNGKNVFPEELEMLISNSDYVKECIVYNDAECGKDCITAKIVYNKDFSLEELRKKIKEHIDSLNERLISYKQIKKYDLTDVEMEKTTTLKIKRWTPAPKTQVTV